MVRPRNKKNSTDIDKLAAFIVNAIMEKKSSIEKSSASSKAELLRRFKGYKSRSEMNSAKVKGKLALKSSMERCSKSS